MILAEFYTDGLTVKFDRSRGAATHVAVEAA
jgi:hypothetical protein